MTQVTHNVFGSVGETKVEAKVDKRSKLKALIELGIVRETVTLDGIVFVLKTSPMTDRVRLISNLSKESTKQEMTDFQFNVLANAIELVDGMPLEALHPDENMDVMLRKIEIVSTLQNPVINALMRVYEKMLGECDSQFDLETIKK